MTATEPLRVPSSMWSKLRKPPVYHGRGKVTFGRGLNDQYVLSRLPFIGRQVFEACRDPRTMRTGLWGFK